MWSPSLIRLDSIQNYKRLHTAPYTNLEGRLLSAAVCTYGILFNPKDEDILFEPSVRYLHAAGFDTNHTFQASPVIIYHGVDDIHAAIVATTIDGVVVAFRGTTAYSKEYSLLDWLHDAFTLPISIPKIKGKVHAGIYHATQLMIEPPSFFQNPWSYFFLPMRQKRKQNYLQYQILHQLKHSPIKKLYFVAHSKGGAMASLAARMFINNLSLLGDDIPIPIVYTFGSTKVGDSVFRIDYDEKIQQYSYENYWDPIPFFPPSNEQLSILTYEINNFVSMTNATSNR